MNNLAPPPEADDVSRALPHAVGPEKSVLSTMLQDPEEFIDIAIEERLSAAHFYLPNHTVLYDFLIELKEGGVEIELIDLVQRLLDRGLLEKVGGPGYLTELYTYAPSPGSFRFHLKHVKDKFTLRAIIRSSNEAVAMAYEAPDEVPELLDTVERNFMAIREGAETEATTRTIMDDIRDFNRRFECMVRGEEAPKGIATGFEEFDRMTGGLCPGDLTVIAARPSMGKTSLMMNIVENVCIDLGKPTLVFSAEMTRSQLVDRLVLARSKYNPKEILRGTRPTKQQLERVRRATMQIAAAPIHLNDLSAPNINYIRATVRRMVRKYGIRAIAVDYLQLCKSLSKQASNSREREVAEIVGGFKSLAKEMGISVVLLAQLNRQGENRSGTSKGKPKMSDLRESGSIEQDADIIGLLYRDAYYAESNEEKDALAGKAHLDIAKNRNGATGKIPLTFIEELMRFETGAPFEEDEPIAKTDRWGNKI